MKISETRSSAPTGRVRGAAGVARSQPAAAAAAVSGSEPVRSVTDVAKFLGITEAELTPNVRRGLAQLLQEVDRLRKDNETKAQRIAHLEKLADQDPLVPILNRRAFVREMSRMMAFAERFGGASSVLFFDVNEMKAINDAHGHVAGDRALDHIARTLIGNVRATDAVGRLGGDEFGVLLAQADEEVAKRKAAQLRDQIQQQAFLHEDKHLHVSVSVGAFAFDGSQDIHDILAAADQAMYEEKRRVGLMPRSATPLTHGPTPVARNGNHGPPIPALAEASNLARQAASSDEMPSDGGLGDEIQPGRLGLG